MVRARGLRTRGVDTEKLNAKRDSEIVDGESSRLVNEVRWNKIEFFRSLDQSHSQLTCYTRLSFLSI